MPRSRAHTRTSKTRPTSSELIQFYTSIASNGQTSSGSVEATTVGKPFCPRLVIAAEPKLSDAVTTKVKLKSVDAVPGGSTVLRVVDDDHDVDSWFIDRVEALDSDGVVWVSLSLV